MDELVDMTGVDPLRRAEVLRRIAVLQDFTSIDRPSEADRRHHAARLGLSVSQFQALVRSWRDYGRASAISGSGSAKGRPRERGPRHLPSGVKEAAGKVIDQVDLELSVVAIVKEVREALALQGLPAPSRSTIWNMLVEARSLRGGGAETGVIVGRCQIRLPVIRNDRLVLPDITLAVTSRGRVIAGSMAPVERNAAEIAQAVEAAAAELPLLVDDVLEDAYDIHGAVTRLTPTAARSALSRTLGKGIGPIGLIYRPSSAAGADRMLRNSMDAPLELDEAARVVRDAVNQRSRDRGDAEPLFVLP